MKIQPALAALAAVIGVLALAILAAVLGFLGTLFIGVSILFLIVVSLIGLVISGVLVLRVSAPEDSGRRRVALGIFAGLLAGALLFIPVMRATHGIVRSAKEADRTALAEKIVAETSPTTSAGPEVIKVQGDDARLSVGGEVLVYSDGKSTAVLFWDTPGGTDASQASIYLSDPSGRSVPAVLEEAYSVQHRSGHWWGLSGE